jgi:hypothetical protein
VRWNRNRKETDEEEAKGETHSTLAFSVTFFRVGVSTLHGPHQLLHCPPTIEMSRVEEEEAMRGKRGDGRRTTMQKEIKRGVMYQQLSGGCGSRIGLYIVCLKRKRKEEEEEEDGIETHVA